MFGKLKDKLKGLFSKSEDSEEKPKEKPKKEKKETSKKTTSKPPKDKKPISDKKKKQLPTDKELKEQAEKIQETVPEKFETGQLKTIPDTDSLSLEPETSETVSDDSKGFFSRIKSKFTTSVIEAEQVDSFFEELEIAFLENNTALEVVDKIKQKLHEDLVGLSVKKGQIESTISESLKTAISEVLQDSPDLIKKIKSSKSTYTIIFFGINGTGKTTSIAKLAHKLKSKGISVALAAADTFRAAAIEQLETHAKKLEVPIIKGQYNADPTSVAFDAKKYAEKHKIQCLLIDTAGRMYTKENLIKQMEKIIRVISPDLKIFVGESIAGNDAIEQVKTFNEAIGIDGLILSKADVDEKSGTLLSVTYVTGKPIYFLGTGQEYKDLQEFNKSKILKDLGFD